MAYFGGSSYQFWLVNLVVIYSQAFCILLYDSTSTRNPRTLIQTVPQLLMQVNSLEFNFSPNCSHQPPEVFRRKKTNIGCHPDQQLRVQRYACRAGLYGHALQSLLLPGEPGIFGWANVGGWWSPVEFTRRLVKT